MIKQDIKLSDGTVLNMDGTVTYFSKIEGQTIRTHYIPNEDLLELPGDSRSMVVHHLTDCWGNMLDEVDSE